MKQYYPNDEMAKSALEGYAEDGVRGKLGYDDVNGWYADLNDKDYGRYLNQLKKNQSSVLDFIKQLPWKDAVNVQSSIIQPPDPTYKRLALYIVDNDCITTRGFKVSASVKQLMDRGTEGIFFGSTCEKCGRKMSAMLVWEKGS